MSQENPSSKSGLSALEKAKLLKQEAEEKKRQEVELSEKEKEQRQRELDEKYLVNKDKHQTILADKKEKEGEVKSVRAERLENIKTQRAAIKEMVGTEEGVELFKEHKKDIFSEDEEKLKNIKTKEKGLKEELKDLTDKTTASEAGLKESYEETTKGKREKEKAEVENEKEKTISELKKEVEDSVEEFLKKQKERVRNLNAFVEDLEGSQNEKEFNSLSETIARKINGFSSDTYYDASWAAGTHGESVNNFLRPLKKKLEESGLGHYDLVEVMDSVKKLKHLEFEVSGDLGLWNKYNRTVERIKKELEEVEEENKAYNDLPVFKKAFAKKPISKEDYFKKMNKRQEKGSI